MSAWAAQQAILSGAGLAMRFVQHSRARRATDARDYGPRAELPPKPRTGQSPSRLQAPATNSSPVARPTARGGDARETPARASRCGDPWRAGDRGLRGSRVQLRRHRGSKGRKRPVNPHARRAFRTMQDSRDLTDRKVKVVVERQDQ